MGSIRRQLIALLLGVGLPLLALQIWNGVVNYRQEVARAQLGVLELARATGAATAELLELSRLSMGALAGVLHEESPGGLIDEAGCRATLLPAARGLPFLANVGLLDARGRLVCATSPEPPEPIPTASDRAWFRQAVATGSYVVSAPQRGRVLGEWVVVLARPLVADGSVRGVVMGSIDLATFQELLSAVSLPAPVLLTIEDGTGTVVARSRDFDEWVGRRLSPDTIQEREVEPGVAITRADDAEGTPTTFARVEIPSVGWRIFAGMPDSVVYGPARRAGARALFFTLPLLLVAAFLGGGLYRRVAGSLNGLVTGVTRAGTREPVPEEGPDEVRAVARAMNRTLEARTRAEDAERQAKERYRSILENAVFGIYLSSPSGEIVEVNPALAAMLGFDSAEDLRASGMGALYPDIGQRTRLVDEHLSTGKPIRGVELEWRKRDGTPITVRLNGKIVEGMRGEPLFEVIVEDITDQRALEEEYRHTQKMEAVGRLAGGVAHDINNVLTAVLGHATLLLHQLPEGDGARADVAEIVTAAQHASALTRQLLAFSRKEVTQPRLLDLSCVVEDLERMVRRLIGEDVEVTTRLPAGLPPVKADPGQMEQVVLNLLVNARDALPDGGRIEVATSWRPATADELDRAPHGWVSLEVSDSGTGMPPEVRDRIFEPFFTTKPPGEGTGLGLSTVYGIVMQGGGSVHVESEPGGGASFSVMLPAALARAQEGGDAPAAEPGEGGRGTILVAEDEPSVRDVARRVLERAGYDVVTASGGPEALEALAKLERPLALLLTDVVMPGMNGLDLADRVAAERGGTPVLFMSGYNENDALRERTRRDPGVFLAKPFTPDELLERVCERIEGGRAGATTG